MPDVTVKRIEDTEAAFGGAFLLARASLGVTSFGMQVLNLPPEWSGPEHAHHGMTGEMEHANDGQEEVYVPLEGLGGAAGRRRGDHTRAGDHGPMRPFAGSSAGHEHDPGEAARDRRHPRAKVHAARVHRAPAANPGRIVLVDQL